MSEETVESSRTSELNALKERKRRRESNRNYATTLSRGSFIMGSFLFSIAIALGAVNKIYWESWLTFSSRWAEVCSVLAMIMFIVACVLTALGFDNRARSRDIEKDIERLELQIDLVSFETSEHELKAEKLLRLNDLQLRRYYDLNLYQNLRVFNLGVGCIVAGLIIIGATIYELRGMKDSDLAVKIATAVLGGVGALLTNFVAAIYLKMNTVASDSLASFHGRLVETHQLMLGNLLASRIDNPEKRSDTLALLAQKLVEPNSEPKAT
jgi:hypothetical protein